MLSLILVDASVDVADLAQFWSCSVDEDIALDPGVWFLLLPRERTN